MIFGLSAAFLNQYANAHVLDINDVGWFTALLVTSGFIFSSTFGLAGKYAGVPKIVPMLFGYVASNVYRTTACCRLLIYVVACTCITRARGISTWVQLMYSICATDISRSGN